MLGATAAVAACADDEQTLGQGGANAPGGAGAGGDGGFGQGGTGGVEETLLPVGDLGDLLEGELIGVASPSRLFLGLDAGGVYAMTSVCTHKSCDMIERGTVLMGGGRQCTCHNSRFDVNGAVLMGPATSPLSHFHVEIVETTVFVDKTMTVDSSFRAPIPSGAGGAGGVGGVGGAGSVGGGGSGGG